MSFDLTCPLKLLPVADRGVPNAERVIIQVTDFVDLASYGMGVGLKLGSGRAVPFYDNFYWFGNGTVKPGDWISVGTRAGEGYVDRTQKAPYLVYYVYWGRPQVVFGNPDVVPILFNMDMIQVGAAGSLPALGAGGRGLLGG